MCTSTLNLSLLDCMWKSQDHPTAVQRHALADDTQGMQVLLDCTAVIDGVGVQIVFELCAACLWQAASSQDHGTASGALHIMHGHLR